MRFHLLPAMAVFVAGCSSVATVNDADVNEDTLNGSYSARFDARDSTLTLDAQFRVGGATGTTVRLQPPAGLTADGESMKVVDGDKNVLNITGTFYLIRNSLPDAAGPHKFVWTRRDGTTRTNVLKLGPAGPVSISPVKDSLSKSEAITVRFPPVDAGDGESVSCVLKSANTNKQGGDAAGESELKKSVSTGRECVFVPGDLARFPGGAATIQVTRYKTGEKLQGHELFGGSLRSEVISKDIPLTISP